MIRKSVPKNEFDSGIGTSWDTFGAPVVPMVENEKWHQRDQSQAFSEPGLADCAKRLQYKLVYEKYAKSNFPCHLKQHKWIKGHQGDLYFVNYNPRNWRNIFGESGNICIYIHIYIYIWAILIDRLLEARTQAEADDEQSWSTGYWQMG